LPVPFAGLSVLTPPTDKEGRPRRFALQFLDQVWRYPQLGFY